MQRNPLLMFIVRIRHGFLQLLSWLYVDRDERLQRNCVHQRAVRILQRFVQLLPRMYVRFDRIL